MILGRTDIQLGDSWFLEAGRSKPGPRVARREQPSFGIHIITICSVVMTSSRHALLCTLVLGPPTHPLAPKQVL